MNPRRGSHGPLAMSNGSWAFHKIRAKINPEKTKKKRFERFGRESEWKKSA